jgi:hypothetical protein
MVDIGRFPSVQDVCCRKKEQQPCQPAGPSVNHPVILLPLLLCRAVAFFRDPRDARIDLHGEAFEQGIVRRQPEGEARLAIFIALKRPGPPAREVLVNLDNILMVQPGQGSGSAILFGREHLVSFEEDVPTVLRRIQTGPYIRTAEA